MTVIMCFVCTVKQVKHCNVMGTLTLAVVSALEKTVCDHQIGNICLIDMALNSKKEMLALAVISKLETMVVMCKL